MFRNFSFPFTLGASGTGEGDANPKFSFAYGRVLCNSSESHQIKSGAVCQVSSVAIHDLLILARKKVVWLRESDTVVKT